MEQEKKLKMFSLPDGHMKIKNESVILSDIATAGSTRPCEGCCTLTSNTWYTWGPANLHCRLCSECWVYWKKYGGLKIPQNQRVELMQQQQKKIPGQNDEKKTALRMSTQINTVEQQRKQKELQNEKEMKKKMKEEGEGTKAAEEVNESPQDKQQDNSQKGEEGPEGDAKKDDEEVPSKKQKLDEEMQDDAANE